MKNVSINCHSSIRIEAQGKVIYFDPFKIENESNDADVIFITHAHYDHFSPEDIEKVKKNDTVFVSPKDVGARLVRKFGVSEKNVISLSPYEKSAVCGFSFETVPAYNISKEFHPRDKSWLGYIVYIEGERVYVAGDTDALDENKNIFCDVAFIPVGGTYTMNYTEAAQFVNELCPKTAVPTHYGSIVGKKTDGESFKALVSLKTQVKIVIDKTF